jgi:hypothetical protein
MGRLTEMEERDRLRKQMERFGSLRNRDSRERETTWETGKRAADWKSDMGQYSKTDY